MSQKLYEALCQKSCGKKSKNNYRVEMILKQIGTIRSPYKEPHQAPRQGSFSQDVSTIQVHNEFSEALAGIDRYEYIIVLYWANGASRDSLKSSRHKDRGIFATRSPSRPNTINFCVCKLLSVKGSQLKVSRLDAVDGSPLLDLKPYIKDLDCPAG